MEAYLHRTGMSILKEKTQYLLIEGTKKERAKVNLSICNTPLTRPGGRWVRVLDISISEKGSAEDWIRQLKQIHKETVHLIKRIAIKFGGHSSRITRTFVPGRVNDEN